MTHHSNIFIKYFSNLSLFHLEDSEKLDENVNVPIYDFIYEGDEEIITNEGYLYFINSPDSHEKETYKKWYFRLINKDLFCKLIF